MTSVTRENFQAGRFNERVAVVVGSADARRSVRLPVQGALPIVPGQANLRFTQRAVRTVAIRRAPRVCNGRTFAGHGNGGCRTHAVHRNSKQSVSRVTHVAYRPETMTQGQNAPSCSHGSYGGAPAGNQPVRSHGRPEPTHSRGSQSDTWHARFNQQSARRATHSSDGRAPQTGVHASSRARLRASGHRPTYARPVTPRVCASGHAGEYAHASNPGYTHASVTAIARIPATTQSQPQYSAAQRSGARASIPATHGTVVSTRQGRASARYAAIRR